VVHPAPAAPQTRPGVHADHEVDRDRCRVGEDVAVLEAAPGRAHGGEVPQLPGHEDLHDAACERPAPAQRRPVDGQHREPLPALAPGGPVRPGLRPCRDAGGDRGRHRADQAAVQATRAELRGGGQDDADRRRRRCDAGIGEASGEIGQAATLREGVHRSSEARRPPRAQRPLSMSRRSPPSGATGGHHYRGARAPDNLMGGRGPAAAGRAPEAPGPTGPDASPPPRRIAMTTPAAPAPALGGARAYVVWIAAVTAYAIAVLQRTTMGVAGLEATERFGASATIVSTFVVLQLAVYALSQIPAGLLLDRYGSRVTLVAGALLMGTGQLLMAQTETVGVAMAARIVLGAGDALTFSSAIRLVPAWFPAQRVP